MRGTHHPIHPLFFGTLFLAALLSAHVQADTAAEKERRRAQEEAESLGNQKTDQQLQPQKMMHDMKQMEHMQKSQEARQRQDESTAQQEQQMAMMEQMKSQQLQQQINANKDSAKKNKDGVDKLSKEDDAPQKQQKGYDADVISVRKGDVPGKPSTKDSASTDDSTPVAPHQLADLTSVSKDLPPQPAAAPASAQAVEAAPPTGNPAARLLGDLEKIDRASVVYDDSAKVGGTTPKVEAAQVRLLTSASIGGGSALGGTAGSATETDIWGNKADAEKTAGESRAVRSRGPTSVVTGEGGAEGSPSSSSSLGALDKDFFDPCPSAKQWKKMPREAKDSVRPECRKLAKKCDREATKSKKKVSDQCREWKGEKVAGGAKGAKHAEQ